MTIFIGNLVVTLLSPHFTTLPFYVQFTSRPRIKVFLQPFTMSLDRELKWTHELLCKYITNDFPRETQNLLKISSI